MRDIIRHKNRDLISVDEWKAIRQSTVTVICQCLDILSISHLSSSATKVPCKKVFYKHYFFTEWSKALRELEFLQPLLSLCSGVWKADKLVGVVLQDHKPIQMPSSHPSSHASSVASLSLSCPHSCPSTPGLAPPSSAVGSSCGVTSSSSSAAPASCQPRPLPRHVILKKSLVQPHSVSGTEESAATSKSAVSMGKRRREPSPVLTEKKKTKANEDNTSHSGKSSSQSYYGV